MGFLSNMEDRGRATKINEEAKELQAAMSKIPRRKYRQLADAVQQEVGRMMKEEEEAVRLDRVGDLKCELDHSRELALYDMRTMDYKLIEHGVASWMVAAYWQAKLSPIKPMKSLHRQLKEMMDGLSLWNL